MVNLHHFLKLRFSEDYKTYEQNVCKISCYALRFLKCLCILWGSITPFHIVEITGKNKGKNQLREKLTL